eukprot:1153766-Pelagomonas_calceolata.AAC.5
MRDDEQPKQRPEAQKQCLEKRGEQGLQCAGLQSKSCISEAHQHCWSPPSCVSLSQTQIPPHSRSGRAERVRSQVQVASCKR